MVRIAVGLEYDGAAYAGWQTQTALRTVQQVAERALARIAAEPVALICAGRTDAGVHARGQVAHFDTHAQRSTRGWVLGANSELPPDVSLSWAVGVPAHFHARYSAAARTYRYLILNRLARSALYARPGRLDPSRRSITSAWRRPAARLIGEHDFSAFRSSECQARSPIRRLERLSVERRGDWVSIEVTANAFLHHMVRNIVGLLLAVGRGEAPPEWAGEVLAGRDRTRSAATAPAAGLYLWRCATRPPSACPPPPQEGLTG